MDKFNLSRTSVMAGKSWHADHATGGACSRARSFEEIVEVTQFIRRERIVARFVDVASAPDTGTNSGSCSEHSTGAGSVAVTQIVVFQHHRSWAHGGCR